MLLQAGKMISSMARWHMLCAMPHMTTAAEATAQVAVEVVVEAGNTLLSHCSGALPCLVKPRLCSRHPYGGLLLPKVLGLLLLALGLLFVIGMLLPVPELLLMFQELPAKAHDLLSRALPVPALVPGPQTPSKTQTAGQGAWVVLAGCKDCDTEAAAPCKCVQPQDQIWVLQHQTRCTGSVKLLALLSARGP